MDHRKLDTLNTELISQDMTQIDKKIENIKEILKDRQDVLISYSSIKSRE